jgi:V8-like Glu-specific endopeptidase
MPTQPEKTPVSLAMRSAVCGLMLASVGLVLGAGSTVASMQPLPSTPITPGEIIGESQLEKARCVQASDPAKYQRSRAVGRVRTAAGYGTVWRVGPGNLVLTNWHVVDQDVGDPTRMTVSFNYEETSCSSISTADEVQVPVERIVAYDRDKDFALLALDKDIVNSGVLLSFGYLGLNTQVPQIGAAVYVAGHPRALPKRISRNHDDGLPCRVIDVGDNGRYGWAKYNCDTEPSSSGSPVIDASTNAAIALHSSGSAVANAGTQMAEIWPDIARYFDGWLPEGSVPVEQPTVPEAKPGAVGVQVPVRVTQVDEQSPVAGAPGEQLYYHAPTHTTITDVSCQSGTTKWIAEDGSAASCTLPSAADWATAQSVTLRVDAAAPDGQIADGRVRLLSDTGQTRGGTNITLTVRTVQSLQVQSGNLQAAPADNRFPDPLTARAKDPLDVPVMGAHVTFAVTDDGGTGTRFDGGDQTPIVQTNVEGDATSPPLAAGSRVGTLQVTATSNDRTATFHLRVLSQEGDPTDDVEQLTVIDGQGQITPEGTEFADPLTTRASNRDRDPVEDAWVTYTITDDGGTGTRFVGVDQAPTVTTSSQGDAVSPKLTAGNKRGLVKISAASNGKAVSFILIVGTM